MRRAGGIAGDVERAGEGGARGRREPYVDRAVLSRQDRGAAVVTDDGERGRAADRERENIQVARAGVRDVDGLRRTATQAGAEAE